MADLRWRHGPNRARARDPACGGEPNGPIRTNQPVLNERGSRQNSPVETIAWEDFTKVELRVGTILSAAPLEGARKPAYRLTIDFGELGTRQSSAQITTRYSPENLIGRQVVAVLNFPPKRIAGFESQCLTTGVDAAPGEVVLISPDSPVPNGARIY